MYRSVLEHIPGGHDQKSHGRYRGGRKKKPSRKKKAGKPTQAEINAVQDYTTDKFKEINSALRDGKPLRKDLQTIVSRVDSFLDKSPPSPGVTYREFPIPAGREADFANAFQGGGMLFVTQRLCRRGLKRAWVFRRQLQATLEAVQ